MKYAIVVILSYLLGSVSVSVLLSKLAFHKDVRNQGSGNAGATNVARAFGMGAGVLTLLGDAGKTVLAMLFGRYIAGDVGMALAGGACLVGHCWPIYFRFKGGKGVSVGAAIGAMIDWRIFLLLCVVFFGTFAICRIVSVCSMACAVALPTFSILFAAPAPLMWMSVFAGILVFSMHHTNIKRLIQGTEAKFKPHSGASGSKKK